MKRYSTIATPPKPFGPSLLMLVTAVVIIAGGALVAHFYREDNPTPGLLGVLGAAFIVGFWQTVRAVYSVEVENFRSRKLMRKLHGRQELSSALQKLALERRGKGPCGYLYSAICDLYASHRTCPGDIDAQPHLEAMAHRLGAPIRAAYRAKRQAIMLGLFGTMLGGFYFTTELPKAMAGASAELQGASLIAVLFAPGGAMAGIGSALVSTLVATLLGGVILSMLVAVPEEAAAKLCLYHSRVLDKCVVCPMRAASKGRSDSEEA